MTSLLLPEFLRRLDDPDIRTVLLCGCGGGFDFVHSLALYPELRRLGKQVVIGSYSFGDPSRIGGDIVFDRDGVIAKRVTAGSSADDYYCPEVHVAGFLDARDPEAAPHAVYAYYARAFTVPLLGELYAWLVGHHSVDAVVLVDGGSDSLMAGDEEGLGDPIEDCVSVATVAALAGLKARILVTVGMGCDRYNHVSDAASLRAIAELSAMGGFLGATALDPNSAVFRFYRDALDHVDARQQFRSVLAGAIVSAGEGHFGASAVPPRLKTRVQPGEVFLWPLMPMLWGFDVERVAQRSLMVGWIRDARSVIECYAAVEKGRREVVLRPVEDLPRHVDARSRHPGLFR
jgi:hypothetical protein